MTSRIFMRRVMPAERMLRAFSQLRIATARDSL